jgi:hypothetical protein
MLRSTTASRSPDLPIFLMIGDWRFPSQLEISHGLNHRTARAFNNFANEFTANPNFYPERVF